jgi:hypothetical protein
MARYHIALRPDAPKAVSPGFLPDFAMATARSITASIPASSSGHYRAMFSCVTPDAKSANGDPLAKR